MNPQWQPSGALPGVQSKSKINTAPFSYYIILYSVFVHIFFTIHQSIFAGHQRAMHSTFTIFQRVHSEHRNQGRIPV